MSSNYFHLPLTNYHQFPAAYSNFYQNFQYNNRYQQIPVFNNEAFNYNFNFHKEQTENMLLLEISRYFQNQKYSEMYNIINSFQFSTKNYEYLQELWYNAHYEEAQLSKKKPLSSVSKYRIRKRFPLPRTIWDGEETSYCFKETTRKLLKELYEKSPFPNAKEKSYLAEQTELNKDQISNWFKNRRQRDKNLKSKNSSKMNTTDESISEIKIIDPEKMTAKSLNLSPPLSNISNFSLQKFTQDSINDYTGMNQMQNFNINHSNNAYYNYPNSGNSFSNIDYWKAYYANQYYNPIHQLYNQ